MDEDLQMLRGRLVLHAERLRDADDRGTPRLFQELQNPQTPRARDGFQLLLEGREGGHGGMLPRGHSAVQQKSSILFRDSLSVRHNWAYSENWEAETREFPLQ